MGFKVIVGGKVTSHVKMIGDLMIDIMTIRSVGELDDPEPGYAPDFLVMTSKLGKDCVTEIGAYHCIFGSIEARAAAYEVVVKAVEDNAKRD